MKTDLIGFDCSFLDFYWNLLTNRALYMPHIQCVQVPFFPTLQSTWPINQKPLPQLCHHPEEFLPSHCRNNKPSHLSHHHLQEAIATVIASQFPGVLFPILPPAFIQTLEIPVHQQPSSSTMSDNAATTTVPMGLTPRQANIALMAWKAIDGEIKVCRSTNPNLQSR